MHDRDSETAAAGLLRLAVLAVVVGAGAGAVGTVFRVGLARANDFRDGLVPWAHGDPLLGLVLVVGGCAAAAAVAAWLARRFAPLAAGGGIPHVIAVLRQELPLGSWRLLPVKFVGGILAIGAGLALGREGPTVQLGASVGQWLGQLARCPRADLLPLIAGGAGAGLATAFNAPIAGAVFVLEGMVRRFDTRTGVATFGASAAAITVSRLILGDFPEFRVGELPYAGVATVPAFLTLGALAGVVGVAYNRAILGAGAVALRLPRLPAAARGALVGAAVGLAAWFLPNLVGGGEPLAQRALDASDPVAWLAGAVLFRFLLGPLSIAARTPGGVFAPLLTVGAQAGLLYGTLCQRLATDLAPDPRAMALVGMAALFTASARAPVTAIIVVVELTGNFTLLLPMLAACFTALVPPTLMGEPSIYDSQREHLLRMKDAMHG